jgi:hypothetical protein
MPRTACLDFIQKAKQTLGFDFKPDDYLFDLTSAACLLVEDGLEIAFSHRSFQEYFVARHISQATPDVQVRLIERYAKNLAQDNVMELLLEINPDLTERQLLVPQLKELFQQLGVKRHVRNTHFIKYFKTYFATLYITGAGSGATVRATHAPKKSALNSAVYMAVRHCQTYSAPSKEYFLGFEKDFSAKYGHPGRETEIQLVKLPNNAPMLKELAVGKGAFSTFYLAAAFAALKQMEEKHSNSMQGLDALLGLKS